MPRSTQAQARSLCEDCCMICKDDMPLRYCRDYIAFPGVCDKHSRKSERKTGSAPLTKAEMLRRYGY